MTFTKTIYVHDENIKDFISDALDNTIDNFYTWLEDGYDVNFYSIEREDYYSFLTMLRDDIDKRINECKTIEERKNKNGEE